MIASSPRRAAPAGWPRTLRRLAMVAAVLAATWLGGLVGFAGGLTRLAIDPAFKADGVVVLTGGGQRIAVALELVATGRGKRLLITGVNQATDRAALERVSGRRSDLFDCCVDIDRRARNTRGNARQAAQWARARNYRALTIVTASYHMPRALVEFSRAMPEMELNAHPVFPDDINLGRWWASVTTIRVIAWEYNKYWISLVSARIGDGASVGVLP